MTKKKKNRNLWTTKRDEGGESHDGARPRTNSEATPVEGEKKPRQKKDKEKKRTTMTPSRQPVSVCQPAKAR
jgi:hypothetical protein